MLSEESLKTLKLKRSLCLQIIQEVLEETVQNSRLTYYVQSIDRLIEQGQIPESFEKVEIAGHYATKFKLDYLVLLIAALKRNQKLKNKKIGMKGRWLTKITYADIADVNLEAIANAVRARISYTVKTPSGEDKYLGKHFPELFLESGIKTSKPSLYLQGKLNPSLPKYGVNLLYTEQEVEMWRSHMKSLPGRGFKSKPVSV